MQDGSDRSRLCYVVHLSAAPIRGRQVEELRNHVLVIDIDDDLLIAIEHTLEDQGFDTTITWDESEALELLAARKFELVLVCDHPPELHAIDILQHIQEGPAIPLCLVAQPTQLTFSETRFFLSLGAKAVLCKRNRGEIAEQIRKCLAQAKRTTGERILGRRAG